MNSEISNISKFERAKLLHDYFKYLATLSTGSTAFLVTFSDKFAGGALCWFILALVAFMISAVSSVTAQTSYIWHASSSGTIPGGKYLYIAGLSGGLAGFVLGVLFLVVFAMCRVFNLG